MISKIKALIYLILPGIFQYPISLKLSRLKNTFHHGIILKKKTSSVLNYDWSKFNQNRISIINSIISNSHSSKLNFRYLEIGCNDDGCFNSIALPINQKIGVDPFLGGTIRLTSDEFFLNNTEMFDLIFIDGLHTYEACQRDLINSLKFLKEGGTILLHDMLPLDWKHANNVRLQGKWCGDVWKVGVEASCSKGLSYSIALVDQGIGIVRKLDNAYEYNDMGNTIKNSTYEEYVSNYLKNIRLLDLQEIEKEFF